MYASIVKVIARRAILIRKQSLSQKADLCHSDRPNIVNFLLLTDKLTVSEVDCT